MIVHFACREGPASQGDVVFFQADALAIALFPRRLLAEDAGVPADGAGFMEIGVGSRRRSAR